MAVEQNHYGILELDESATDEDIRKAFRRLSKEWHPDHNKSKEAEAKFKELTEAKRVLLDPDLRRKFDRSRRESSEPDVGEAEAPSVPLPDLDRIDFGELIPGGPAVTVVVNILAGGSAPWEMSRHPAYGDLWIADLVSPHDDDTDVFAELHVTASAASDASPGRSTDQITVKFDGTPATIQLAFSVAALPGTAGATRHRAYAGTTPTSLFSPRYRSRTAGITAAIIIVMIISVAALHHSGGPQSVSTGSGGTLGSSSSTTSSPPPASSSSTTPRPAPASSSGSQIDDSTNGMLSVSCASNSFCLAADDDSKMYSYSNGNWSGVNSISDVEAGFTSVSCPTSSFCAATSGADYAYIDADGAWTTSSLVGSDGSAANLTSVSCATAGFCVATGDYDVYTFSDGKWSSGQLIQSNGFFSSISCPTISFCMAVTTAGAVYLYSNSTWSAAQQFENDLTSVSCPTTSFCAATSGVNDAYIDADGTWTTSSLVGSDGNGANLTAVSCATSGFCVATGDYNIYTFSAAKWSSGQLIQTNGYFSSISCPTTSFCMATDGSGYVYSYLSS